MTTPVSYVFLLNILADLVSAFETGHLSNVVQIACMRACNSVVCKDYSLHTLHVYIAIMSLGTTLHIRPQAKYLYFNIVLNKQ